MSELEYREMSESELLDYYSQVVKALTEFKLPSTEQVVEIAENILDHLFDDVRQLYYHYADYCPYDFSGEVSGLTPKRLEEIIQECKNTNPLEKGEYTEYEHECIFLEQLYTGQRTASYCPGCGWFFQNYVDVFEEEITEFFRKTYPLIAEYPCEEQLERFYNDEIQIFGQLTVSFEEAGMLIENDYVELFKDYLRICKWERFIEPVRAIVMGEGRQLVNIERGNIHV